jgi:hypothetical protein
MDLEVRSPLVWFGSKSFVIGSELERGITLVAAVFLGATGIHLRATESFARTIPETRRRAPGNRELESTTTTVKLPYHAKPIFR